MGINKSLTKSNWPSIGSGWTVWCFLFCDASLMTCMVFTPSSYTLLQFKTHTWSRCGT